MSDTTIEDSGSPVPALSLVTPDGVSIIGNGTSFHPIQAIGIAAPVTGPASVIATVDMPQATAIAPVLVGGVPSAAPAIADGTNLGNTIGLVIGRKGGSSSGPVHGGAIAGEAIEYAIGIAILATAIWDAVTAQSGGLTPGARYYLSQVTPGHLTTVKPGSGEIVQIGTAISTTAMLVAPTVTASSGGGGIAIEEEGTPLGTFATINFVGAGVTAVDAGAGVAQVTIPGGGGNTNNTVDFLEDFIEFDSFGHAVTGATPQTTLEATWVGNMVGGVGVGTVNSINDGVGIWPGGGGVPSGIGSGAQDYTLDWYAAVDGVPGGADDYTAIIGARAAAAPTGPTGTNGLGPFCFIHNKNTYGNDHWWAYFGGAIDALTQLDTGLAVDALAHKFTISYVAGTNTVTFSIDGVVVATHVAIGGAGGTFVPGCSIFFTAGGAGSYDIAADYVRVRLPNNPRP
jgi:hypothetical protein